MFATIKVKRHWPRLEHLYARASRHAYQDYCEALYERELLDEQRRAKEGVRIMSLKEFQAGLARGQILARIPGELHEWSQWITPSREFAVSIFERVDGQSFSTVLDYRGCSVGLFEADTMRLDHFVSWDEFLCCYHSWSLQGIPPRDEEGPREEYDDARGRIVIAPMDIMQSGAPLPAQPNGGKFEPKTLVTSETDLQAKVMEAQMTIAEGTTGVPNGIGGAAPIPGGLTPLGGFVTQYPNPPIP